MPDGSTANKVQMMAGMGLRQEDIAAVVGLSEPTLRKYYADELAKGTVIANMQVAQSLFRAATDKEKPNITAMIFWLKARGGWVEPQSEELGKKEKRQAAAEKVSERFAASAPPRLVAAGGRKV